jgi:demethylmenaquinone methyltransferase/2-methoxy-6-polyprenyl-1,4-benzoquinol methylase
MVAAARFSLAEESNMSPKPVTQLHGTDHRPHPTLRKYYGEDVSRRAFVNRLFDDGAPYYDRIISWMSLGTGNRYRREALERAGVEHGSHVLDAASGTGPVAAAARELVGEKGRIVALDPSRGMLLEDQESRGLRAQGIAEMLPFPDASFDFVTMGYALRHVATLEQAFAEYLRVLKPGGRVLILEISAPDSRALYHAIRFYLNVIVPWTTRLVTRSARAQEMMHYYWHTIDHCVPAETILAALRSVGFEGLDLGEVGPVFKEYRAERPRA